MIAATTTKPSAGCEAVARENPVVKPKNVKRSGDLVEFDMLFLSVRNKLGCIETNKKVKSYWLGLNEFADLSHEEFKKEYLGLKTDIERGDDERSYQEFAYKDVDVEALPNLLTGERKEPRLLRKLLGVFDSSAVEGTNKIVTENLTIFSEQERIDCETVTQSTTMAATVVSWITLLSKFSRSEVFARKRIILTPWKKELARPKKNVVTTLSINNEKDD
ncbi:hypothetical protein Bca4012_011168 [Brassica carinata]